MLTFVIIAWVLGVLALAIYRPAWAILAVITGTPLYLLRTDIGGIPTTALELGIYTVSLALIISWLRQGRALNKLTGFYDLFKTYRWALLLWLGVTVLSAVWSPDWRLSFGILKGWFFDPLLLLFLLTSLENGEDGWNSKAVATYGLVGAATVMAGYGLYDYWWGYIFETGRLDAFYTSPNYAAMFLAPVLFISLGYLKQIWNGKLKFPWLVANILIAVALLMTQSFGAYVAVALAILIGLGLSKLATHWRLITAAMVIVIALTAGLTGVIKLSGHYNDFYKVGSWQIRTELWRAAGQMIQQKPLTGVGLGYFQRQLPILRQAQPGLFQLKPELLKFHLPHNLYLTIASESGGLALAGFLWFVVWWLYSVYSGYIQTGRPLLLGCLLAMTVILIHGLVDTTYFKNDLSVLWWLIVWLGLASKNPQS